jgi:uncharacterized repeat protein (TIGR03803 family)
MRGRLGWVFAFFGLLVATAPTSLAQAPAVAPTAMKSRPQGGSDVTEQTLYSFCSQTDCTDGAIPAGPLIMDASGNLYGTTQTGGKYISGGGGVVFELTPNQDRTGWTQTILYTFCAQSHCEDGSNPNSLIMDASGNLYGTTFYGGPPTSDGGWGPGTVFKLTPAADGWTKTVLYEFASGLYVIDGKYPLGGLIMDGAGSLYGTTFWGGANNAGAVFRLTPNQDGTAWTETLLYSFCSQNNGNSCIDGGTPRAGLVMDNTGNLFGTTQYGGTTSDAGVVFRLTPNQDRTSWAQTVIHNFCSQGWQTCADGGQPMAELIIDGAGSLIGATSYGGGSYGAGGAVYKLTPDQTRVC